MISLKPKHLFTVPTQLNIFFRKCKSSYSKVYKCLYTKQGFFSNGRKNRSCNSISLMLIISLLCSNLRGIQVSSDLKLLPVTCTNQIVHNAVSVKLFLAIKSAHRTEAITVQNSQSTYRSQVQQLYVPQHSVEVAPVWE